MGKSALRPKMTVAQAHPEPQGGWEAGKPSQRVPEGGYDEKVGERDWTSEEVHSGAEQS